MTRRSSNHTHDNMVNDTVQEKSPKNFYNKSDKEEDIYQKCQNCGSYKLKIQGRVVQCLNCNKNYLYKPNISIKLYEFTDDEKNNKATSIETVSKQHNKRSSAQSTQISEEPEVIDLLSSDDESTHKSSNTSDPSKDQKNFLFEPWNIKEKDREPISYQKDCGNYKHFILQLKAVQMGRFFSNSYNSESAETSSQMSFINGDGEIDGITIKLMVGDNNINITVGLEDIEYVAIMFHDPFYFLCIKIAQVTCDLYFDSLMKLQDSWRDDPDGTLMNELNKGRLFAILDVKKEHSQRTATKLEKFFKYNYGNKNKFIFLNRPKSEEIVNSCIGGELSFKKYPFLKDMHKFSKKFVQEYDKKFVVKYPPEQSDSVVIKPIDMNCLEKFELLNDNVISFYLKYIQNELLTPADRSRTHIFDTFFYHRLTQSQSTKNNKVKEDVKLSAAEKRYLRVKNWTRNVNLFEKDFLIVPINKKYHWYVAIICYPYLLQPEFKDGTVKEKTDSLFSTESSLTKTDEKPEPKIYRLRDRNTTSEIDLDSEDSADEATPEPEATNSDNSLDKLGLGECVRRPVVLIFDSLRHSKKAAVVATLKQYLQSEWSAKNEGSLDFLSAIEGHSVQVPLQSNNFDCGIFLLQYVEHFFKDPITDYRFPINLSQWFPKSVTDQKRSHIKNILADLDRKQREDKLSNSSVTTNQPQIETVIETRAEQKHLTRSHTADKRPVQTNRDLENSMDFEESSSETCPGRVGHILMDIDSIK